MGFGNTTDSAFKEILLHISYNGTCKFVNIVTQCNELSLFKYSRPIRVRHFTMARFQNKNKRLQRISDENGPLNIRDRMSELHKKQKVSYSLFKHKPFH